MTTKDAIIEVHNLCKEFKGFTALDHVSFSVARGTIHALIGPNGAGKTTCFNLLTKFLNPTRGSIYYEGRNITHLQPADIACLGLVRSFQISAVFPQLTVMENVRIALQRKRRRHSYDFWRSSRHLDSLNHDALQLIDAVGLTGMANLPAAELSYGHKRAVELATTLALVIDCHTRELLGWHLSRSGKAKTAESALEQALITRYGTLGRVPTPFLLRSDNGLVFTSRSYTALVRGYGLRQEFITPHTPEQNGMVERVIRTLKEQCAHRHRFETLQHASRVIGDWISFYNHRRPHQALGMKTPAATFALAA